MVAGRVAHALSSSLPVNVLAACVNAGTRVTGVFAGSMRKGEQRSRESV